MFQVQKLASKVIHSTTLLLPAWREILEKLNEKVTYIPCDIATHWNFMFDILDYVLQHRKAVDGITQRQELGLRRFELSDEEWWIVEQLHKVLLVHTPVYLVFDHVIIATSTPGSQGHYDVLLMWNSKPGDCNSSNGSHSFTAS